MARIKRNQCLGWEIFKIEITQMNDICFLKFGNTVKLFLFFFFCNFTKLKKQIFLICSLSILISIIGTVHLKLQHTPWSSFSHRNTPLYHHLRVRKWELYSHEILVQITLELTVIQAVGLGVDPPSGNEMLVTVYAIRLYAIQCCSLHG
jgi:hypothetical protein